MKLVVFGATGGIGGHLVQQALAQGHEVTAIVRTPAKMKTTHPQLRVVQGDVTSASTLDGALAGHDAVLLVLGVVDRRAPTRVFSSGASHVVAAMQAQGVRRLICVSASGFVNDPGDAFLMKHLLKPMLQRILKNLYEDLQRMEAVVRQSELDWTLVRPARLTDGARTGTYRTAMNANVAGGSSIARADVADFMLKHLDDAETSGAAVGIAY